MDKKDFSNLEDQIKDTVKNAFKAIDFVGLKEEIGGKAGDVLNGVKTNLNNKSRQLNEEMKNKIQYQYQSISKKDKNKEFMYISKRPIGSISGIVYSIFGFTLSVVLGILLILYSIWTSFILGGFFINNFIGLGILLAFFIFGISLIIGGSNLRKRVRRFKEYVNCLNGQNYCSIKELANVVRKKEKFVVKDLRKMIELGFFKEAYIDDKKSYFMLSNEVYENYIKSQESYKERTEYEIIRQEHKNEKLNDSENNEVTGTIEVGKKCIEQIKSVNDAINDESFSIKLNRLENIVSQILNYVDKNPEKLSEVNKFANHYLPITLKLVNSYKELNDQKVQGDNIKNAKNEIEKSIDIINNAFEKLLDDLFEEIALDISSDISVLQTLFKQEGLTEKDFKK